MPNRRKRFHIEQFANKMATNGFDATRAMKEISPNVHHNGALANKVHRWLEAPEVLKAIADEIRRLNISPDDIRQLVRGRLIKIIRGGSRDSDAINASSVIGKIENLIKDAESKTYIIVNAQEKGILTRYGLTGNS